MFYLGLDLGKKQDYSAIAVVERYEPIHAWQAPAGTELMVRHLERLPLGTPYPAVVERVRALVTSEELRHGCLVAADATGVGDPVLDILRGARLGCEVTAVTITSGSKATASGSVAAPACGVPKQDLIAGLQVILESRELKIAEGLAETGTLVRELMDVRYYSGMRGRQRIGADGSGEHDDLVIALALAVWRCGRGPKKKVIFGDKRLF